MNGVDLGVGVCHVNISINYFGCDLLFPVLCLVRVFAVAVYGPFGEEGAEVDCAQVFS